MKKTLFYIVRFAVSIGLLGYLIYLADLKRVMATLRHTQGFFFLLAVVFFLLGLFLLTGRWKILLAKSNIYPGFGKLLVFYLIGYFFNNFLPTTIGGDVSRAILVAQLSERRAESVGIVLFERIMGLLATLTLASLSLLWVLPYFHTRRIVYLTFSLLIFVSVILAFLFSNRIFRFIVRVLDKIEFFRLGDRMNRVLSSIHIFRHHKFSVVKAFGLSLCGQISFIFMNLMLAQSLNLHQVSLGFLFLVIPVAFLLGLFPSINGLGVRDTGYVFLLTRIGLDPAQALSLSFLNTLVPMLMSILGGIFFIFYRSRTRAIEMEVEKE